MILIRKLILAAIQAVRDGNAPKGVSPEATEEMIAIDSFTGVRAKGLF